MLRLRKGFQAIIALALAAVSGPKLLAAEPVFKLTYDRPAAKWTEALPLGNGRIGAMVFGGTEDERLQLNESTLWGGGPHDYTNSDAYGHLDEIRQGIFAGKLDAAEKLSENLMGKPKLLMPYQPFCDLRLHFAGHGQAAEYRRELHLDDATSVTTYKVGAATFRREVFVSYPDQVLVLRLTASEPGQLTFSIGMDSPQAGTNVESTADDTLQLSGQIQPRQNPPFSWTGSWDQPGVRFAALLKVLPDGGSVRKGEGRLDVFGANSVTILFSNATSFKNYRDISGEALSSARVYLDRASQLPYESLRKRHVDDFHPLFSRVQLSLGEDRSAETTDQRIRNFAANDDPSLLALYFEFGRYLLLLCSRPGGQPANLQGIWNEDLLPAGAAR